MSDASRNAPQAEPTRPALEDIALALTGAAHMLDHLARSTQTPAALGSALELLSGALHQTAQKAKVLIDDVTIDLTEQLGISTADLAQMNFAPVNPPFRRRPASIESWVARARAEFELWGAVEAILIENDAGLERRFNGNADAHLDLVEALEKLRKRWQDETKLLEATLLRLAVVVARWEQSGGG